MDHKQMVVVLDFGSQYTQLIARRIREQRVYSEILPWDAPPEEVLRRSPRGIVLSGGPASSLEPGAPVVAPEILASSIPVLGICYGMQALTRSLGGTVRQGERAEYGRTRVKLLGSHALFEGVDRDLTVWMSHWDQVETIPPGTVLLAQSEGGVPAAFATPEGLIGALQFHPEVVHTASGALILANFLFRICRC
ncbi:MAG TPA: glutamine-hydrolyzing GMP synthase, partial [Synergistaceae bacterium]|nr:glutamine-hydrolyzing GMP synthase [Synergistaceae bacterium]